MEDSIIYSKFHSTYFCIEFLMFTRRKSPSFAAHYIIRIPINQTHYRSTLHLLLKEQRLHICFSMWFRVNYPSSSVVARVFAGLLHNLNPIYSRSFGYLGATASASSDFDSNIRLVLLSFSLDKVAWVGAQGPS